jgi:hypothetical protein
MDKIQLLEARKAAIIEAGKEIREQISSIVDAESFVELSAFSFSKNSFLETGEVAGGMDTHHYQECHNLSSYLKKNGITLEQLLFSPNIEISMNR